MDELTRTDTDQVVNPTEIMSKEKEDQPTNITIDEPASTDKDPSKVRSIEEDGECGQTSITMDEQTGTESDQVVSPTDIMSKEEEDQTTNIAIDEPASTDNGPRKVMSIEEDGECQQTTIQIDEQIIMNNDQVVYIPTSISKEEDETNMNKEDEDVTIKTDEQTSITTQNCLVEDDKDDDQVVNPPTILSKEGLRNVNKEERECLDEVNSCLNDQDVDQNNDQKGTVHQRKKRSWEYLQCSCLSIICVGIMIVYMIIGSIYIYRGYRVGSGDFHCVTQPLIPVFLIVYGILVSFHIRSAMWQFHSDREDVKYVYNVMNLLSPAFLVVFTIMILPVIHSTHDDSSKDTYCPFFLYWFSFITCLAGLTVYSCIICIIWFIWMANKFL